MKLLNFFIREKTILVIISIIIPLEKIISDGPYISERVEKTASPIGGAALVKAPSSPKTLPCIFGSTATRKAM